MSLFITILLLQMVIFIVNTIGPATINELAWRFSAVLPLSSSRDAKQQLAERRKLAELRREMHSISATDDFARWAKARRNHDKQEEIYKATSARVETHRQSFDQFANISRIASLTVLPWILQWYYAKSPIFSYPADFLPVFVQRILSFASAPNGTVSIGTFNMVTASVISLVGKSLLSLAPAPQQKSKQKVAMPAKKEL